MTAPRCVLVVAGATASGKTDLGEALADGVAGEVVCADARQLFAELEIGTGKPTAAQRAARAHHLFDALHLGERASAGAWARLAGTACEAAWARGSTPVLVGGSGLYLRALIDGLHAEPPHDATVRAAVLAELHERGAPALHAELAAVDAPTAARLQPADGQRVTRALEVWRASGRPLSWWHAQATRGGLAADWRVLELTCEARALAARIEQRTRALFDAGLVEETQALLERGLGGPLAALRAIGYDEALAVLDGRCDRAAAEARTSARTRTLAKRQRTWFRHQLAAARVPVEPAGTLLARACAALGIRGPGTGGG